MLLKIKLFSNGLKRKPYSNFAYLSSHITKFIIEQKFFRPAQNSKKGIIESLKIQ